MTEQIQSLVHALRAELEQYGELLALLEQQQQLVIDRAADRLLENLSAINAQTAVVQVARRERELRQAELAAALQLPGGAPFAELTRLVPAEFRLLVEALLDEINACLKRTQHRARQNHLLLSRSIDLLQRFMAALFPAATTATYRADGRMATGAAAGRGLCEVTA